MCGNKVTAGSPYICPVRETTAGFDHLYARGKIVIAQGLLEGKIEPSPALAEALFSCTLCGNCMNKCGSINQDTGEPLPAVPELINGTILAIGFVRLWF